MREKTSMTSVSQGRISIGSRVSSNTIWMSSTQWSICTHSSGFFAEGKAPGIGSDSLEASSRLPRRSAAIAGGMLARRLRNVLRCGAFRPASLQRSSTSSMNFMGGGECSCK